MTRDEGFAIADVATAKLSDPKFRALWRELQDEAAMNAATQLYEAVQLASWQHGERVKAEDAAPFWMADVTAPTKALVRHKLLDATHRIPQKPWKVWFGAASERRKQLRDRWRRAKDKDETSTDFRAESSRSPRGVSAGSAHQSVSPSVPSEQSVRPPRAPAGSNGFKEPESTEERLARYRAVAEDSTKSPAIREAAQEQVKLMEQGRVH